MEVAEPGDFLVAQSVTRSIAGGTALAAAVRGSAIGSGEPALEVFAECRAAQDEAQSVQAWPLVIGKARQRRADVGKPHIMASTD